MNDTGNLQNPKSPRVALRLAFILMVCFGLTSCGAASFQSPTEQGTQAPPHTIILTWDASSSPVSGYVVYRATDIGETYVRVQTTLAATTQYTDTAVAAGHTYFYVVTSYDSANAESIPSNVASATVPVP